jgi:hypothetical protein
MRPGVDYDPDPINLDEFGLENKDRAALAEILHFKGSRAARETLEQHFGITFDQLLRDVDKKKRQAELEVKMQKDFERFLLHFPLFLNTARNQATILNFLEEKHLSLNYKTLCYLWNELAHVDGALDLDETVVPSSPYWVGQITPGAEFDTDYKPKKRVTEMTAEEFTRNIVKSPKFRQRIDGTE